MDWISHLGSGSTFTPFPQSSDPSPSLTALELCPLVAAVSLAWAGCVRLGAVGQRSCWGLVPVRARSCSLLCIPAGLRVWGQLCVPCVSCGQERGLGCVQDRDILLQPHTGSGELSPSHSCPPTREVASLPGAVGLQRLQLLLSPSVFPLVACSSPDFGDAAPCHSSSAPHPALLLPCFGASTPSSLGAPWPVPIPLPAGISSCPGCGRDRVQCFPSGQGRFAPASASFPCLSPHLSSPLAAAMECPWSSHIRSQIWLLPLACSSTGSPCFPAFPQQLLPWKSQGILAGILCAGVLLVELLGLIPSPGTGAGRNPPGRNPARPRDLHHSPSFPHGPA